MSRGSERLTEKRKNEIIDACEQLYQTKGFHDITIKDISQIVSISRPSIYNYFETKEEIFLALLIREHEKWADDIQQIISRNDHLTSDELAHEIADTLEKRKMMLKISAMNLYEIEINSRDENLVEYKKAFRRSIDVIQLSLKKFIPELNAERIHEISYAFFTFLYGIYPNVYPIDKQIQAMEEAGIHYQKTSISELVYHFLKQILR